MSSTELCHRRPQIRINLPHPERCEWNYERWWRCTVPASWHLVWIDRRTHQIRQNPVCAMHADANRGRDCMLVPLRSLSSQQWNDLVAQIVTRVRHGERAAQAQQTFDMGGIRVTFYGNATTTSNTRYRFWKDEAV